MVLTLNMDNGTAHPARLASGTKDMAITGGRLSEGVHHQFLSKNIPWVGQTDVGLGVPTEAHLAQEAGFFR